MPAFWMHSFPMRSAIYLATLSWLCASLTPCSSADVKMTVVHFLHCLLAAVTMEGGRLPAWIAGIVFPLGALIHIWSCDSWNRRWAGTFLAHPPIWQEMFTSSASLRLRWWGCAQRRGSVVPLRLLQIHDGSITAPCQTTLKGLDSVGRTWTNAGLACAKLWVKQNF